MVPKFWWLRLASKQGVPENEIPPLRHHERFLDVAPPNSGCTVFALTKNDKYVIPPYLALVVHDAAGAIWRV